MITGTTDESHQIAIRHLQAGRLDEAEAIYRQILSRDSSNALATHLLGVIALQRGQPETGVDWIRKSLAANPGDAQAHANLANALCRLGRFQEAIAACGEAIRLDPHLVEARNTLGVALLNARQPDAAVVSYRESLAINPNDARIYANLGDALRVAGRLDEAVLACRASVQLRPDYPNGWNNLGIALSESRQHEEAIVALGKAIELKPDLAEAYKNLGAAYAKKKDFAGAVPWLRKAIELKPDFAEAYTDLSDVLRQLAQYAEAIAACAEAIRLAPNFAKAYTSLGEALSKIWQHDQAIAAFRKAISLDPSSLEAHNSLGNCLSSVGQIAGALESYREAMRLRPRNARAHSNYVFTLNYSPDHDAKMILEEQRRWNEQHGEPLSRFIAPHSNDRDPDRRLRIGWISPDFRGHMVGRNVLPVLREKDQSQVEIFCYSNAPNEDSFTNEFRRYADAWRDIRGLPHAQAAELIRQDRIDILVDLALHTGSGLLVLARKPAPVQVTFAGYPGGTGLPTIDWRLTDPYLDPPGVTDGDYVERSYRLPETFWCYDPAAMACEGPPIEVSPPPALSNGFVTLGSLNNFAKVNRDVMRLWAQVLKAVEGTKMLILCPEGETHQRVLGTFAAEGIAPDRLELIGRQHRRQYFELYQRIDIALDSVPYGAHTTGLDAFWMGVPMVTIAGSTVVGRAGVSQLSNLGLQDLIARGDKEYVHIASELAQDRTRLKELRAGLRTRMLASPLTDAVRFTRNIEAAYRQMWQAWCVRH